MDYLQILIVIFANFVHIEGKFTLEIVKNENGIEIPVSESIKEYSGSNLTLVCKLTSTNYENPFDDHLSWGRKHKFLQLNNELDWNKLARNKKYIFQYNKSDLNKATRQFFPLQLSDSGIYFCASSKYKLFKIIKLEPEPKRRSINYNIDLKAPRTLPKFLCTEDAFICKSSGRCVEDEFLCDGVNDCIDNSDESIKFCGINACASKRLCSSGRCIPESLCCNKFENPNCTVNVKHPCCFETKSYKSIDTGVKFQIMWIVVPCVIILVFIAICVILSRAKTKPGNSSMSMPQDPSDFHISLSNYDLPPSYEEAMRNTPTVTAF